MNELEFSLIDKMDTNVTTDKLFGVDITITERVMADDNQSMLLKFNGQCNVPWNHHQQTILRGKYKGKTLQALPTSYVRWSMKTSLERAVSLAAELQRREMMERLIK